MIFIEHNNVSPTLHRETLSAVDGVGGAEDCGFVTLWVSRCTTQGQPDRMPRGNTHIHSPSAYPYFIISVML